MIEKIKNSILLIFHGKYDTSTPEGRANERARSIAWTAITAALARLFSMAIPLITIKISLEYLGGETYGLWAAVISFFSMFVFADLGLGSGLQTELSRATGKDDINLCTKFISSAYAMLTVISIILVVVFIIIFPFINWGALMNAETETAVALAGGVVLAIVSSKILGIPLALVQRTQMALQEGYRSNLWQCGASLLSLVSIYSISWLDLGPLTMIWASSMIVVVVSLLNTLVFFGFQRPDIRPRLGLIDKQFTKALLKTGFAFFLLSILTSLGLSMDNFIVARTCSLNEVTQYSILFRVAYLISIASTMLSSPMWAANGEALSRGEYDWVKKTTIKMVKLSFVFSIVASIGLLLLAKPVFRIWLGTDFTFSMFVLMAMCLMQIAISVINPYFMILNAAGVIKKQIYLFAVYTPISLIIKYVLSQTYGMVVIPWIGLVCYIIMVIPITFYYAKREIEIEPIRIS